MTANTEPEPASAVRRFFEPRWVAALFMLACFAGASLVGWHWFETPWPVRTAELGGLSSFGHLSAQLARQLRAATADPWLPALGLALLAAGGLLGRVVASSKLARRLSVAAAWTLLALAGVHLAENWLLDAAASAAPRGPHLYAYVLWLQALAFLGYALLPTAGLAALLGGLATFMRLVVSAVRRRTGNCAAVADAPSDDGTDAHWRDSAALPPGRSPGGLGICLSGGGIRSATFGLGALQSLQEHRSPASGDNRSELTKARYLTAVSGGAYAAGALLLATHGGKHDQGHGHDRQTPPAGQAHASLDFDHVFRPGSPEYDHLRKHSSYIADSFREWAVAILVVIRGASLSMLFLGLIALTAGRWAGFLYHQVGRRGDLASPWHPVWGPVFATLGVTVLALLLWLGSTRLTMPRRLSRGLASAAHTATAAAAVLVVFGALIPIVTWGSMAIINATGGAGQDGGTPAGGAAKGGVLAVSGVIVTIAGLLLRRRSEVVKAARTQVTTWRHRVGDIGGQAVQWLAVYLGLAVVAAVYLIIFGYSAWIAANAKPDGKLVIGWGSPRWTSPLTSFQLTLALTVLLLVVYLLIDETVIGLHPFYRRRLASAFAVRRVLAGGNPPGTAAEHPAGYTAKPYEWGESTELDAYRTPSPGLPGPQIIFCAAAHCSDPDETPPGRHVLPFTFSYDYIGGPETGWCQTKKLRKRTSRRLRTDLTVQTAMAVSGAAFASAAGSYRRPTDVVLALINARLGTWLPNPSRMRASDGRQPWWTARLPRIRRLSYLVREILGWYPKTIPLLFVTDGGLYENLGLIELLRHRCTEIYCFDASSDTETFGASLARSITLAYDELGILITPVHPEQADPSVSRNRAEAGDLRGRLADTPVITATITYRPDQPDGESVHGVLVIGRATLDPSAPWEIRRHAAAHPVFPADATGDQWFNDRKFNAYSSLGRHVGRRAVEAMEQARRQLSDAQDPGWIQIALGDGSGWAVPVEVKDRTSE